MPDDVLKKDAETLDQALLQLTILGQAATTCSPVNLDIETSVNLAKVARYESRELLQEAPPPEGKAKTPVEYISFDPPRFAPFLVFDDGSEMELSTVAAEGAVASQNEIFRQAWGQYSRLFATAREYLTRLFPPPAAPAAPAPAETTTAEGDPQ